MIHLVAATLRDGCYKNNAKVMFSPLSFRVLEQGVTKEYPLQKRERLVPFPFFCVVIRTIFAVVQRKSESRRHSSRSNAANCSGRYKYCFCGGATEMREP